MVNMKISIRLHFDFTCVCKSPLHKKNLKTVINLVESIVLVGLYFYALAAPGP